MENIKLILGFVFGFLIIGSFTMFSQEASAALDSKGTEFLIGFLNNYYGGGNLQLHITSDFSTQATVNYPANSPTFTQTVNVNPGQITIVNIPSSAQTWTHGQPSNNAIKITSPQEITVYTANIQGYTSDAGLALPTDAFSFKYIVSAYSAPFLNTQFVIVSPVDNTTVTITPSQPLSSGQIANSPFTVTLNKGQGVSFLSASSSGDLSGTIITSDKPIGLTNGDGCTNIPLGVYACDHVYEHGIPVQGWGTKALVTDLPDRPNGSIYRVFSSADNTNISIDGSSVATKNEGQFYETSYLSGNHIISGNNPIFVVQFMPGQGSPGSTTGDPAMANVIPSDQYLNSYTFSTVGGNQFARHFVTIIASNSDTSTIKFDGAVIGSDKFTPIGSSGFSAAKIDNISQGTHTTSSTNGHGLLVGGLNSYDSYLYPGGAAFEFINPQPEDDRDGDGVPDLNDECPDEFAQTENGCPEQIPQRVCQSYDFDGEILSEEFSGVTTTESVAGFTAEGFGGNFLRNTSVGNPAAKTILTLTNLPAHDFVDIGFLLAIIDSWDGEIEGQYSPDIMNVEVDGTPIFSTGFVGAGGVQTYVPSEGVLLLDINQGINRAGNSGWNDSAYNMANESVFRGISHTSDTLTISWYASGSGWQGGDDESWAIDNLEVCTDSFAPQPEIKKKSGDNQWDSRPTFGNSHEERSTQIVENGFKFNGQQFTITDNHWTSFEEQAITVGTTNTFEATVYADQKLKVQEFLFGIPNVGESQLAELGVEVWYDFEGNIEDVKVVQKSDVIYVDTVSVIHGKVKCKSADLEAKCDNTSVSMTFLEPLKDKVMAIKAIDYKNRDQRTYLNEGFDISGPSLNPMLTQTIPSNVRDSGLIQITQVEKYSPYWVSEDGRMFEMNSFGSFKEINQKFERFQDSDDPRTRLHSGFGEIMENEKTRATEVFDSDDYISNLPDSFAYQFPAAHERIDEQMKQEMKNQENLAKWILEHMDRQIRDY